MHLSSTIGSFLLCVCVCRDWELRRRHKEEKKADTLTKIAETKRGMKEAEERERNRKVLWERAVGIGLGVAMICGGLIYAYFYYSPR